MKMLLFYSPQIKLEITRSNKSNINYVKCNPSAVFFVLPSSQELGLTMAWRLLQRIDRSTCTDRIFFYFYPRCPYPPLPSLVSLLCGHWHIDPHLLSRYQFNAPFERTGIFLAEVKSFLMKNLRFWILMFIS